MLIGDLLEHRAQSSPERVFWEEGEKTWTYADINEAANRIACALRGEGLRPGDHVAIQAVNGPAYLAAHFGAAKAGVVLAHLNAHCKAGELARLIEHCEARLVFASPTLLKEIVGIHESLSRVQRWVVLPQHGLGEAEEVQAPPSPPWASPSWTIALHAWREATPGDELPNLLHSLDPEAPFQLLYTSGTTGSPKGALISHRAKFRQGTTHALNMGLQPGDRLYSPLPLYHQFAQWLILVSVPIAGATVVARPTFDASDCLNALAHEGITHLPAVPTMLYRLLDHPGVMAIPSTSSPLPSERPAPSAPHLRCIVYGGAPVAGSRIPSLRKAFPGVRLFQGFGQTETGYCLGLHDEDHDHHPEALGRPDVFSDVRLVDESGVNVPDGTVGEIIARTPYLMKKYHRDPKATAAYFEFGDDWGRTGDLAVRDEGGYFTLAGRKDDLIISGGVNIYPAEIEQALLEDPDVVDAAVLGLPDSEWGEVVVATLLLRDGASLNESRLAQRCRDQLAGYKCPRRFIALDAFPRTPSGKVQKHLLSEQLLQDVDPSVD